MWACAIQGVEFVRHLASLNDEMLRAAAIAAYFGRTEEAHDGYIAAGRPDLAVQLHAHTGDWLRVRILPDKHVTCRSDCLTDSSPLAGCLHNVLSGMLSGGSSQLCTGACSCILCSSYPAWHVDPEGFHYDAGRSHADGGRWQHGAAAHCLEAYWGYVCMAGPVEAGMRVFSPAFVCRVPVMDSTSGILHNLWLIPR